jgi:hypothetical protein
MATPTGAFTSQQTLSPVLHYASRCLQMLSPQMALAGQPTSGGAGQGGAPEPEQKSFGAERTKKLINETGTPEAARPGRLPCNKLLL